MKKFLTSTAIAFATAGLAIPTIAQLQDIYDTNGNTGTNTGVDTDDTDANTTNTGTDADDTGTTTNTTGNTGTNTGVDMNDEDDEGTAGESTTGTSGSASSQIPGQLPATGRGAL